MSLAFKIVHNRDIEQHPILNRDAVPLVLDLDECLIRTDLLFETALAYVRVNPLRIFQIVGWALRGRAHLKRRLAEAVSLDLSSLPANEKLVNFARAESQRGRTIYLATAADELLAIRIAMGFPFIGGVIGSNGDDNLKGKTKADFLAQRFPDGFDYAGDSAADMAVWQKARRAIVVNASPAIERAAAALQMPVTVIAREPRLLALVKSLRLHQWAKNTLVFVAAILSGEITQAATAISVVGAFFALGLVASGTYLINDLWDLPNDRRHRSKRNRPLASGSLSIAAAIAASIVLIITGMAITMAIGLGTFATVAIYLVVTLAYSMALKRVPILDGFVLASLFTLRIAIGIATAGVYASPWLLVFSMFLFASLSFAKRHTEVALITKPDATPVNGRGYIAADVPLLLGLGLATGTASILIMVLYLINDAFAREFYGNAHWLWALPAVLFLWISRIWLVGQRGQLDDDPVAFAVKDRLSIMLGGAVGTAFVFAWAGIPL